MQFKWDLIKNVYEVLPLSKNGKPIIIDNKLNVSVEGIGRKTRANHLQNKSETAYGKDNPIDN